MPIKIHCRICGKLSPLLGFANRMKWLREHRKKHHSKAFKKSIKKSIKTREDWF